MKGPIDAREERMLARRKAAKRKYPSGKPLARIEYFEIQRGIPATVAAEGRVFTISAKAPRVSKKMPVQKKPANPGLYAKAHQIKMKMAPKFAASVDLPVWRPLGPSVIPKGQTYVKGGNNKPPVSGRCSGIYISPTNPQHLVLCSGGGGLWGTLDQGTTWRPLTDDQPTLSMGAIAGAPGSPNIVYAGTGEGDNQSQQGVGLLRSSDGGQTWKLVPTKDSAGNGNFRYRS
jgi:hypothetical protein